MSAASLSAPVSATPPLVVGAVVDDSEQVVPCGVVHRAKRTWVGFAEGMTAGDMLASAQAAADVVQALDESFCALLVERERAPELAPERRAISLAAARGARFEVTHVTLDDSELSRVSVRLRTTGGAGRPEHWLARVARLESVWSVISIAASAADPDESPE